MNLKFKMKNSDKQYIYKGVATDPQTGNTAFLYQDIATKQFFYSQVEMVETIVVSDAAILLG